MARGEYTSRSFSKQYMEAMEKLAKKHRFDSAKELMKYATRKYLEEIKGETFNED